MIYYSRAAQVALLATIATLDIGQHVPEASQDGRPDPKVKHCPDHWMTWKTEVRTKDTMKAGRNDPCPCGSGKKFKRCHLLKPIRERSQPQRQPSNSTASV